MKFLSKCNYILLPRLLSKLLIRRLSTLNKNVYAVKQEINTDTTFSETKVSTLFVPGRHGANIYQMVKPIIDFNYMKENAACIESSCKARGIELDIQYLLKIMEEWDMKRLKHQNISKKFEELKEEADRYTALGFVNEANSLIQQSNECIDEIKNAKEELYSVEDIAMPLCAKVPNILDALTPLLNDSAVVRFKPSKSTSSLSSHVKIGQSLSLLEFINLSPTAYFLKGPLAELEMSVQVYFSEKLQEMNFSPMSCADFVKSFILEATGLDPYSCDDCIPLKKNKASSKVIQNINLVGGASFQSFCAYLVNMNTSSPTLPARYYCLGRHYDAGNRQTLNPSLFSVVQSSSIYSVILSDPDTGNLEFDSILQYLIDCYSHFKIPFRTVDVAAPRLNCTESRRIQIELWSPALLHYVPVAYVSQRNDFVSKRLHITFGEQFHIKGYCNIVEGTVVNVPVLLGCLMENYAVTNDSVDFRSLLQLFEQ